MESQTKFNERAGNRSYLWLMLAMIIFIFSNGRWAFAVAAWVGPVLLLRFVRLQKPLIGYVVSVLVLMITTSISWLGVMSLPLPIFILSNLIGGLFLALPYLADRLAVRRLQGFVSTLLFPVAMTSLAYVMSFIPDRGTWGEIVYTQYGILPLMQLSSITGIYGITFLIFWFASTVNYCWENDFAPHKIKKAAGIYLCVLLAVFLYGGARLVFIKPTETNVRVAAITTPSDIRGRATGWITSGQSPFHLQESLALLESQTADTVRSGAKIVAWQEYGDLISTADRDAFITHARKIAADHKIYLLISMAVMDMTGTEKGENVSIFIDPAGNIQWKYLKSYLVPGIEKPYFKEGDKIIPVLRTPYGKMASVICFDFDFPAYVRSAGRDISLFLVPSFDWKEITPLHSHMAVFRAVENGFSVVRPVGEGFSIAVDSCGRVIASQNYATSKERVMLADVPVQSVFTIYSVIGDLFAWLCVIGLIILIVTAVIRRKQKSSNTKEAV